MERVINKETKERHYRADTCVVWCFDDRFSGLLSDFIAAKNFKHVDLIKVAGGAKGLANPESETEREYLLDQITKSIKLHKPPVITLMVHADCGAYGRKFESESAEQKFYADELNKAGETVTKFLAQSNIEAQAEKYFADFNGLSKID